MFGKHLAYLARGLRNIILCRSVCSSDYHMGLATIAIRTPPSWLWVRTKSLSVRPCTLVRQPFGSKAYGRFSTTRTSTLAVHQGKTVERVAVGNSPDRLYQRVLSECRYESEVCVLRAETIFQRFVNCVSDVTTLAYKRQVAVRKQAKPQGRPFAAAT